MAGKCLTKIYNKALLPRSFNQSTLTGLLLLLAVCVCERSAQAALRLELIPPYPGITSVRVTGNVNDMPIIGSLGTNSGIYFNSQRTGDSNSRYEYVQINAYFGSVGIRYAFAKYGYISNSCATDLNGWRSQANAVLNGMTLPLSGIYGDPAPNRIHLLYSCSMTSNGMTYRMDVNALTPGYDIEVINPPPAVSVCSLNGQNMSLDFNSASLNVNGLSQTQNLNVSCTSGTAKDYNLRLTGSNVTGGRLNFGNGVSAQIYLNGTAVSANAAMGIRLDGLTSRTVAVKGELVGTASSAGVTNAYGVLILDAL